MPTSFLKEIVDRGDIAALDIYFVYSYDQSSVGGKTRHKTEHKNILGLFFEYNLGIKHSLDTLEIERKIKSTLSGFINPTTQGNLPTVEDDNQITGKLFQSDIKKRMENLDNLEKEVLSFVLSYISLKTQERSKALDQGDTNLYHIIRAVADRENERDILYYMLTSETGDHKEWMYIFNQVFDRNLRSGNKIYIYDDKMYGALGTTRIIELSAYELGNIIVKSGLGYWEPWVTGSGNLNVHLELVIPKFLYDIAIENKTLLPEIQDFEKRVKEIEKRMPDEMALNDYFPASESEHYKRKWDRF